MANVTFISACYGRYDSIKQPVTQAGVTVEDWILVTDEPEIDAPGWTVVVEPRPHLHPNVAAKIPKFRPDLYTDAPHTIWVDASALIQPTLAERVLDRLNVSTFWVMFPHPNRYRISDEVVASRGLPKYDDLPLEKQVQSYFDKGYPDGHSLWASGVIGRHNDDVALNQRVGDEWLMEVNRWGFQDQLSLPYVLWRNDVHPVHLAPDLWANPYIWFDGHGR
jgi:hypothetical protein